MLRRQPRYQHVAERLRYFLRYCLVSLRYAYCPKKQLKKYRKSLISRTIPSLFSPFFGKCAKRLILNLLWSMKFESGTEINHFANKNFPKQLLIHRYVEFSKNVDWNMMSIISLKMNKSRIRNFIESDFSDGNNCLK